MTDAWIADGCREVEAARAAGEHEIAAELVRFIEERAGVREAIAEWSRRKFCRWCAEHFLPAHGRQRFCSDSCRREYVAWEVRGASWEDAHDEARTQRMIDVIRREPDLTSWAIAERFGVTEDAARRVRDLAGVDVPDAWLNGWRV